MEKKIPLVSVIIPVYNGEAHILECVKCLQAQTLRAFEAIFIDDGSQDSSRAILESVTHKDKRIRFVTKEHQNAGAARNRGIKEATGTYLIFLDVDDRFEPELLKSASDRLERTQADIVVYHFKELYGDGTRSFRRGYSAKAKGCSANGKEDETGILDVSARPEEAMLFGGASIWNKMYRADLIRKGNLHFDEIRIYNDVTFVVRANLKAQRIACLDQYLYTYYCNVPNSISARRGESFLVLKEALRSLEEQTGEVDPELVSMAKAHFMIKIFLLDVGDYGTKDAEEYFQYCQNYLKTTHFSAKRMMAFYPQLCILIWLMRLIKYRQIRFLDQLGIMKYIRKRIHGRKIQKKK